MVNINDLRFFFSDISFMHLYREQNLVAYVLYKRGITLCPGFMFFELRVDGIVQDAGSLAF